MHRETTYTAIPASVKAAVAQRDSSGGRPATCIICGRPGGPWCHVVPRSNGGMGVEQNIVTLCNRCHIAFDEGLFIKELKPLGFESREDIKEYIISYIKRFYTDWTPESVTYRKYGRKE